MDDKTAFFFRTLLDMTVEELQRVQEDVKRKNRVIRKMKALFDRFVSLAWELRELENDRTAWNRRVRIQNIQEERSRIAGVLDTDQARKAFFKDPVLLLSIPVVEDTFDLKQLWEFIHSPDPSQFELKFEEEVVPFDYTVSDFPPLQEEYDETSDSSSSSSNTEEGSSSFTQSTQENSDPEKFGRYYDMVEFSSPPRSPEF